MSHVKGAGSLKGVLGLAGELVDRIGTTSLHVIAGPDPRGEDRLLDQWREAHRAVAIAHQELSRLADLLAASDNCSLVGGTERGD